MAISKQDRGVALVITIILVVCTVSLIIVGSFLWNLISPGLNAIGDIIGRQLALANTNYNFTIPQQRTVAISSSSESSVSQTSSVEETTSSEDVYIPLERNYNFVLPRKRGS